VGRLVDGKANATGYLAGCTLVMAAGCVGVGMGGGASVLMVSLALIVIGFYGMQGPFWALPASFLTGEAAAGGLAMITMLGIFGGFLGPYGLGLVKDLTGSYRVAMLALGVLSALSFSLIFSLVRRQEAGAAMRFAEPGVPVEAALD
jgi:ACS family tartrate transporter-like MFS transporter